MPLSWNEIRDRAIRFSKEWEKVTSEDAEAKSFWDGFFDVFGISRKRVATFETHVRKNDHKQGFIDLLWKGVMLIEHKSRGKDLDRAFQQAKDYFPGLKEADLPRYILVCDFFEFRLYDLEENIQQSFTLPELYKNIKLFGFIAGYQTKVYKSEDPVNVEAAERMGKLHDKLKAIGYEGHALEVYLVRILFCLFAEDTSIFEKRLFQDFIENKTREDGSDLAGQLQMLFYILNTPREKRLKNLDDDLNAFPYVNGKLFEEPLPPASFDSAMRELLIWCCALDWSRISPAIFGSLFQSVMDPKARRNLGAHYTSEQNILKVIKPLFLDALWKEFEQVKESRPKLQQFHEKLAQLHFLDPACGCGNFLIITYRELRLLEVEVIRTILFRYMGLKEGAEGYMSLNISQLVKVDVDQMHGIEYEEFASQVAQVALWMVDHQMNMRVSELFGEYFARLPLSKSANIVHGNSLRMDWRNLGQMDYIFGNPPFLGKQYQVAEQKADMETVMKGVKGAGVLDYVTAWYIRAAQYMHQNMGQKTKCAFVSTNSISQGEQVGILWGELFTKYRVKIHFAHRTFKWGNDAKGQAAVHCVIIGFANHDIAEKSIFEYENISGEPHEIKVKNINPYLVEGRDVFLIKRREPICDVPDMAFGSMPNDGGFLILSDEEKIELVESEPNSLKFIRPFIGSYEFLNSKPRWCLWLVDIDPKELKSLRKISERVNNVKEIRANSPRATTQKLASFPTLFGEIRQPMTDYLVFPEVSSERRKYIPIGFVDKSVISSNKNYTIPTNSKLVFGILSSIMHVSWVKYVSGRLKSDFQYSTGMVYNNYPWPEKPSEKAKEGVEAAAAQVLEVRGEFPGSSLADLYDPLMMPPKLVKAHAALDKAVDLCYRPQPFPTETSRIEFLFDLYDQYTSGLFGSQGKGKKRGK